MLGRSLLGIGVLASQLVSLNDKFADQARERMAMRNGLVVLPALFQGRSSIAAPAKIPEPRRLVLEQTGKASVADSALKRGLIRRFDEFRGIGIDPARDQLHGLSRSHPGAVGFTYGNEFRGLVVHPGCPVSIKQRSAVRPRHIARCDPLVIGELETVLERSYGL